MVLAFKPPTDRDDFSILTPPDPGFLDFMEANFDHAHKFNPLSSVIRARTMFSLDRTDTEILSPEQAAQEFPHRFLDFDEPISRARAQFIHEEKLREDKINETIAAGRNSTGRAVAGFSASLAASFLDPINIAAGFIPVVGQAKWLNMVRKAGGVVKFGRAVQVPARTLFARGAVEGLVGNALVEPIVLFQAGQEQSDYGFIDTIYNLSAGALIGGVAHIPAGKLKARFDRVKVNLEAADWEIKQAMFDKTLSDMVQDHPVQSAGKLAMLDPVLMPRTITGSSFGKNIDFQVQRIGQTLDHLRDFSADAGMEGSVENFMVNARRIHIDAADGGFIPSRLSRELTDSFNQAVELVRLGPVGQRKVILKDLVKIRNQIEEVIDAGSKVKKKLSHFPRKIADMNRKEVINELRKFTNDFDDDFKITTKELKQELMARRRNFRINPLERGEQIDPDARVGLETETERVGNKSRLLKPRDPNNELGDNQTGAIVEHIREFSKAREEIPEHVKLARALNVDPEEVLSVDDAFLMVGDTTQKMQKATDQLNELMSEFVATRKGVDADEALKMKDLDIKDIGLSEAEMNMFATLQKSSDEFLDARKRAIQVAKICTKKNL